MNPSRARLELCVVTLGILLLGLTPYPRAFTAAMRQAESHRAVEEYGAALVAYEQAIHLDPESPCPWLRTGEVLLVQHRFDRATVALLEADRLGGGEDVLLALGKSYAGRNDWRAATETWLRALASAPDDARVFLALAQASIAQGYFDQAVHLLSRALESQRGAARPGADQAGAAHALLGRLLVGDDPAQAAVHLRQAGDQDMLAVLDTAAAESDAGRRALLLGAAFLQRDELSLARDQFERAIALDSASAEAHAYLGHVLDHQGATAAARQALERALALDPDSALAYYFLGLHDRQVGNLEGAQADLWQALRRDPENAAMRAAIGQTFANLGDYAYAEEWYQGAVEVAPEDIDFHLLLIHFYLDHLYRVTTGGLPAAQAAAILAPDDARTQDLLGWAYHLAGQQAEGELALAQALTLDPDLVSAHYHLGSLLASTGSRESASHHLQRAADLDTTGYYRTRAEMLLAELAR
jgi:tetratricopeptide (TPR) repeat protein